MTNPTSDPRYDRYNNEQLAELIVRKDIDAAEKERMEAELTRRLRDDLLRAARRADKITKQERRGRTWRKGKLIFVLLLILLCLASMCMLAFLRPDLIDSLRSALLSVHQFFSLLARQVTELVSSLQ